jgi:hypothetical protein
MTNITTEILASIEIGAPRRHENMTIHPIHFNGPSGPEFISLEEGLKKKKVVITEVSEGGSVPHLAVKNLADVAVLIMDGEALQGAKQNRVVNTTIMVAAGEELMVPVSCTEQGRWSYSSPEFATSDHVMRHDVRSRKMGSVHASLNAGRGFVSDQMEVWDNLSLKASEANVSSPTGAMSDTFEHYRENIDDFVKAFGAQRNQAGLLAYIDGRLAGCDFISRPKVYKRLHDKLLRSYAVDAVVERPRPHVSPDGPQGDPVADFLAAVAQCEGEFFPSVAMGEDVRFTGPDLIGSALVIDGGAVHSAFFPKPADTDRGTLPDLLKARRRAGNLWDKMTG